MMVPLNHSQEGVKDVVMCTPMGTTNRKVVAKRSRIPDIIKSRSELISS